jgi:hypothetical protein
MREQKNAHHLEWRIMVEVKNSRYTADWAYERCKKPREGEEKRKERAPSDTVNNGTRKNDRLAA